MDMDDYESLPPSTPLYVSCCAGALAGVAEHCAMYPVDSVKVCIFTSYLRFISGINTMANRIPIEIGNIIFHFIDTYAVLILFKTKVIEYASDDAINSSRRRSS